MHHIPLIARYFATKQSLFTMFRMKASLGYVVSLPQKRKRKKKNNIDQWPSISFTPYCNVQKRANKDSLFRRKDLGARIPVRKSVLSKG